MKYLLILVVVIVVVGLWQSRRRSDGSDAERKARAKANRPPSLAQTTEIVACAVCQVHLPRSEALTGPGGNYCSAAHRKQAGN